MRATRGTGAIGLLLVVGLTAGCDKAPAEAALQAAERAIESVRVEAERFAPDQLKAMTDLVSQARAQIESGEYDEALDAVKDVPARVQELAKAAATRRDELTRAWARLQATVPERLEMLRARVAEITNSGKLPKDLPAEVFDQIKAQAAAFSEAWMQATELYAKGELFAAANRAAGLRSRAEELLGKLDGALRERKD